MKQPLIILFFEFLLHSVVHAIELENRLPASVWEVELRALHTPSYDQAFNGYGKEAPLQQLILWDREWRDSVEGKLHREEQSLEIRMAYGMTESWIVKATIPYLKKNQTPKFLRDISVFISEIPKNIFFIIKSGNKPDILVKNSNLSTGFNRYINSDKEFLLVLPTPPGPF